MPSPSVKRLAECTDLNRPQLLVASASRLDLQPLLSGESTFLALKPFGTLFLPEQLRRHEATDLT